MFLTEFDNERALIEPEYNTAKNPDMPEACLLVFSHVVVEEWVQRYGGQALCVLPSVTMDVPVYKLVVDGFAFALVVPYLGGPGAAGNLEQLIALGARRFVAAGCCGVLRHDIADGHLIVPTAAIRDEGLSHHYIEPSDEIDQDAHSIQAMRDALCALSLPYVEGKTWTTDAFYRETPARVARAKGMGAIGVEMECASLIAVARYRGVPFAQFLWGADNLDTPEWDARGLASKGVSVAEKCMAAAIEIARRL